MAKNNNFLFKVDLLLLSVLRERDKYAYEMVKEIAKMTDNTIIPKQGTIYPVIHKLIDKEYVSSTDVVVNNKIRVYYHIEEKGLAYLESITNDYDNLVQCIDLIVHGTKHHQR